MKLTLSESQMLQKWELLRGFEPLRLDCTVTRTDGVDLTQIHKAEMRRWYLDLLDNGPAEKIIPVEVSAQAFVTSSDGLTVVTAPDDARRILSLQFSGWSGPVAEFFDAEAVRAYAANEFCLRPMAARINPRTVIVAAAAGELTSLLCAIDHGPQAYIFDDSAL